MKYVGVDIGGTNLKAGLVDEEGNLLATQKMKVAFEEGAEPKATMEEVLKACKKVERDCEIFF